LVKSGAADGSILAAANIAGLVLGLTQVASFIPARRAARLDVLKALAGA